MSTPLKWTVTVDDREHPIGGGKPILTACQGDPSRVQVWTDEPEPKSVEVRAALVVGTGQSAPEGWEHVGSVVASYIPPLVWHVYRQAPLRTCPGCGGTPSFVTSNGTVIHNDCPGRPAEDLDDPIDEYRQEQLHKANEARGIVR